MDSERRAIINRILDGYSNCHEDEQYMLAALELAKQAYSEGEVPVGCVIVRRGIIIAGDYNGREKYKNAVHHAELSAIDEACRAAGGWRITDSTLYVTLEPCPMCAGAIWNARIPRVVIGAKDAKAGAMGSLISIFSYPLNYKPEVKFGVLENECRNLMTDFFAERRKNK